MTPVIELYPGYIIIALNSVGSGQDRLTNELKSAYFLDGIGMGCDISNDEEYDCAYNNQRTDEIYETHSMSKQPNITSKSVSLDQNLSSLLGKFGLLVVDDRCIDECNENPLIVPKLYHYQGMGLYSIIASVKGKPRKYFYFPVGGPNGYEAEDNHKALNLLTVANALTFKDLIKQLKQTFWAEVVSTEQHDSCAVDTTITHYPDDNDK